MGYTVRQVRYSKNIKMRKEILKSLALKSYYTGVAPPVSGTNWSPSHDPDNDMTCETNAK